MQNLLNFLQNAAALESHLKFELHARKCTSHLKTPPYVDVSRNLSLRGRHLLDVLVPPPLLEMHALRGNANSCVRVRQRTRPVRRKVSAPRRQL